MYPGMLNIIFQDKASSKKKNSFAHNRIRMSPTIPPTDANLNSISLEYPYDEIVRATKNFAPSYLLGRGSYGAVFRGVLKDGTEVAIKVLNNPKDSGFKEEVLVLSKFRHPNLVILMGFSRNGRDRYLVYELLPGGDLCSRLQKDLGFDWRKRMNACLDAALGLSHLHNASPKVFHRDIKTQNILLDRNGSAKMADFGLALLVAPRAGVKVEQCSGTLGYADPLYISSSVVTERSEVYSLGMVLLEVLTAKPPAIQNPANGQVQYVYNHLRGEPRNVMSMIQWRAGWPPEVAQRVAKLALACIDKTESQRPVFIDVVARLRDLISRFHSVGPTAFYAPPPVAAPMDNGLLQNQFQLEEALKKLNNQAVKPMLPKPSPPAVPAPPVQGSVKWNPFDISDDEAVEDKQTPGIEPPPPVAEVAAAHIEKSPVITPVDPVVEEPPVQSEEPVDKLIHRAVADFDEELRALSAPTSTIDKAMSILFPSSGDSTTEGTPPSDKSEVQRRDVARHLLSAGFTPDQVKEALKRTRSVEAAVEWIVEQRWD